MLESRSQRGAPFFVGDHLALDFLNTVAAPKGEEVEWLANGEDLVGWLRQVGVIDAGVEAVFSRGADPIRELDLVAEQARALREWLRSFLNRHAGSAPDASALADLEPLNRLLARDHAYSQVGAHRGGHDSGAGCHDHRGRLEFRRERRWTSPEQLLQPIAEAIVDLLCHGDFRMIRTCEGLSCELMFYDRTKGHARRWCSMTICGNRAKAAAHRARQRRGAMSLAGERGTT